MGAMAASRDQQAVTPLIWDHVNPYDELARKLWRAHAEGHISDADAEALSEAIEAPLNAFRPKPKRTTTNYNKSNLLRRKKGQIFRKCRRRTRLRPFADIASAACTGRAAALPRAIGTP